MTYVMQVGEYYVKSYKKDSLEVTQKKEDALKLKKNERSNNICKK